MRTFPYPELAGCYLILFTCDYRLALPYISLSESHTYLEVWPRGKNFSNPDFPNESLGQQLFDAA